nr:probable LRR receptor-like serine/threonine-protein kinase At5g63710 isoform X2 [Ipomoea batatas]
MPMREGISPGGREYTMYRAFTIEKLFLKLAVHLLMLLVLSRSCYSFNKPKVEGGALIDLLKALNDTNGKVVDWNIDFVSPCDSWSHVTCKNGNVTSLSLASNGFSGTLSPSITKLKYLESLDLHDNNLSGAIPDYLGGMLNLQILNLGNNKFSGSIPADLGQLPNLKHLVLRENDLSGPIPNSLVNITGLKELDVSSNDLAGGVPVQLFSVPIYK